MGLGTFCKFRYIQKMNSCVLQATARDVSFISLLIVINNKLVVLKYFKRAGVSGWLFAFVGLRARASAFKTENSYTAQIVTV
jgi:hypothetical protein